MKLIKCPYCNRIYTRYVQTLHLQKCCKEKKSIDEMRWDLYKVNLEPSLLVNFEDIYKQYSKPDILKIYGLNFAQTDFICKNLGIHIRDIKEACKRSDRQEKIKKSCVKKYGVENPSQASEVKAQKKATFLKHYGVTNIFKVPNFLNDFTNPGCLEKYGLTKGQLQSKRIKDNWLRMTDDERYQYMVKTRWNGERVHKGSSLEKRVSSICCEKGLNIELQKKLNYKDLNGKTRWMLYDIYLKDFNILIETNGDFWHANPLKYKESDILNFPGHKLLAKDIWERDNFKKKLAEAQNFKIKYFWESEMNNLTDAEIFSIVGGWLNEDSKN